MEVEEMLDINFASELYERRVRTVQYVKRTKKGQRYGKGNATNKQNRLEHNETIHGLKKVPT